MTNLQQGNCLELLKELGLDFIGFELNQDYFDIAKARIENARQDLEPLL